MERPRCGFLVRRHSQFSGLRAFETTPTWPFARVGRRRRFHQWRRHGWNLQLFDSQPLTPTLSGLSVGYRIIQLYSQTSGRQTAKFTFALSQGTQDVGSRYEIAATFSCTPARNVSLRVVRDEDARPTTAAFVFRDAQRRVYQLQAKRLPPDFGFHPQGYRADGDTIRLPDGEFEIEFRHEPESIAEVRRVTIDPRSTG